jgi:hypothetical protein
MKKLTILLFSILIPFSSYGEWTEVVESVSGDTYYMDIDTIKEHNGYAYWWKLGNYLEPSPSGTMSFIEYVQVDCAMNRYKTLSISYYKRHMGEGTAQTAPTSTLDKEWEYRSPGTVGAAQLEHGCNYVK